MTYFYLALACILFSSQFVFSKLYQKNTDGSFSTGLWMSFFGAVWMLLMFLPSNGFNLQISSVSLFYAALYSIISLISSISSFYAMIAGKVSTVTLYLLLGGLILPFIYGIAFLGESLTFFKIIGIILMLLSFVPSAFGNNKSSKQAWKKKGLYIALCIICFLSNGFISIISKAHQISLQAVDTVDFLILTAIIRMAAASVIIFIITIKNKKTNGFIKTVFSGLGPIYSFKWIGIMFLIAGGYTVMNGMGNVFSLTCAETMDSSIQFPVISGAVVTLTAILSRIFFKEKIKKQDALGILLAISGIIMFII